MILPLTGAVVGTLGGGAWALNRVALATLRPPSRPVERTPIDLGLQHEDVEFASGELTLRGWWIEPVGPARDALAVLTHGWTANAGMMLPLAAALAEAGHPVLAFDVRAHGRSDPTPVCTVRHYRDDVAAAVRHAGERHPGRPTVLVGHSMGAAAAALVAADGHPVQGLALLACPADVLEVTRGWMRDKGLPGQFLIPLLVPFWRLQTGEPGLRLRPESRLGDVGVPTVIVQGGQDRRVPPEHAERLARILDLPVLRIEDADHMGLLERPPVHQAVAGLLADVARASI